MVGTRPYHAVSLNIYLVAFEILTSAAVVSEGRLDEKLAASNASLQDLQASKQSSLNDQAEQVFDARDVQLVWLAD